MIKNCFEDPLKGSKKWFIKEAEKYHLKLHDIIEYKYYKCEFIFRKGDDVDMIMLFLYCNMPLHIQTIGNFRKGKFFGDNPIFYRFSFRGRLI